MKPLFDPVEFGRLIAAKMDRDDLSLRDVERQSGVDHANVQRVRCGKPPNVENFVRLVRWLEAP